MVRRAAADERRRYDWAVRSLEAMGANREVGAGVILKQIMDRR
jgi:hypothetical protein